MFLFAVRESVQDFLGFSPFENVFGHSVPGPLKLMKGKLLSENRDSASVFFGFSYRSELAFKPGDNMLVLLPIPGRILQARYFGPYIVKTPDRFNSNQLCHVNILKP